MRRPWRQYLLMVQTTKESIFSILITKCTYYYCSIQIQRYLSSTLAIFRPPRRIQGLSGSGLGALILCFTRIPLYKWPKSSLDVNIEEAHLHTLQASINWLSQPEALRREDRSDLAAA